MCWMHLEHMSTGVLSIDNLDVAMWYFVFSRTNVVSYRIFNTYYWQLLPIFKKRERERLEAYEATQRQCNVVIY